MKFDQVDSDERVSWLQDPRTEAFIDDIVADYKSVCAAILMAIEDGAASPSLYRSAGERKAFRHILLKAGRNDIED